MNRELGDFWLYYRPGAKSWVISKGHYLGKRSFASPDDVIQIPSFDILPTFIQQVRNLLKHLPTAVFLMTKWRYGDSGQRQTFGLKTSVGRNTKQLINQGGNFKIRL